jgi:hypothetical protein
MATLPNAQSKPLPRLSIFKNLSTDPKRKAEAWDLVPLILKLDQIIDIDDIDYAADPPDFAVKIAGQSIGVELTAVNPALFGPGGNRKKQEFREWQARVKANPEPVNIFEWGTFTLAESLASLKAQFESKTEKTKRWPAFDKKWLLLHLDSGSPFSDLVGRDRPTPGAEQKMREHRAKVVFEVCSILAAPNPFDYVLMFAGCDIVAFPYNGQNPHKFPMPRWDLVARGARVDNSHLTWKSTLKHIVRTGDAALKDDQFDGA